MVGDVLESGVTFEDAFARLRTGRRYAAQQAGIFRLMNQTSDGVEHYYAVNVPETYDPSHKYQVRFQLHGGVDGRADNQAHRDRKTGS